MTEITGTSQVLRMLKTAQDGILDDVADALIDIGHGIEGDIKKSMRGFGGGHSAPNRPPAVQTGRLRASITSQLSFERKEMIVKIGPQKGKKPETEGYAFYLEFGTTNMIKRPYLRPAFSKNKNWVQKKIKGAVARNL